MGIAVIALLGALLSQQDLAGLAPLQAGGRGPAMDTEGLAGITAGSTAISTQALTASVSNVQAAFSPGGSSGLRTGDITIGAADTTGFSGIQAISLNTGVASTAQAAISIAAGSLMARAGN